MFMIGSFKIRSFADKHSHGTRREHAVIAMKSPLACQNCVRIHHTRAQISSAMNKVLIITVSGILVLIRL
jgi:hypothetical protein